MHGYTTIFKKRNNHVNLEIVGLIAACFVPLIFNKLEKYYTLIVAPSHVIQWREKHMCIKLIKNAMLV